MSILTFNFHQLVGVQVESDDPDTLSFFEAEYRPYAAPLLEGLNHITLQWRKSHWPFIPGYRFQWHKFLARWSYKIALHENGVSIEAIGNQTAVPMIHHMLIHPSLRYLCSQIDAILLHGSAVVFNNKSLFFTGAGGAGKTTVSSMILSHGGSDWELHADDYIFLMKGPISYSYTTRSHLYRDQIRWVPKIRSCLSLRERLHLEFFGRIRELSNDRIKWPLRIEPSRLWPDHAIAPKADLAAAIILARGKDDRINLESIELTEPLVHELISMNFHEARHYIKLIQRIYGEAFIKDWLEDWRIKERTLLDQILQETPLYRMDLPSTGNTGREYGEALIDTLKPLLNGT